MPPARWFPQTDEEWDVVLDPSLSLREKSRRLGVHATTVKRIVDEVNAGLLAPGDTGHATSSTTADAGDVDEEPGRVIDLSRIAFASSIWLAFERVQEEVSALEEEQLEVSITLDEDAPVLVVFLSDLHIGHQYCQMRRLREDLELVRNTPGCYVILGGDLIDNVVASKAGRGSAQEQLAAIRAQRRLVDEAVSYLGPERVLAMVRGNHEYWTVADADYDPVAYFASRVNCAFLGDTGFVNLTVGSQTYRILVSHAFRMRSSFNATHQAKRLEDFWGDADVVFTGHTHDPAAESAYRRLARHFYGQAGTYMRTSRYAKSKGYPPSLPDMPGAILFHDHHDVLGLPNVFAKGIHVLSGFRGQPCHCRYCQREESAA